jgi:asparagine synthase (glutamine-hydrolysing)
MCGIWGFITNKTNKNYDIIKLFECFNKIKYRGPDTSRFIELNEFNQKIFLGFHRLAIIDRYSSGDQPFVIEYDNRTIYSITNGEIYNYMELIELYNLDTSLSKSDCYVIPLLYEKFGAYETAKLLDGEFSTVILDFYHETGELKVSMFRDPLGIRPLFYNMTDDHLIFGSELKSVIINDPSDTDIRQFQPGYILEYTSSGYKLQLYTDIYNNNKILDDDVNTICQMIRETLEKSVISMLNTERPLGALLSGGLDSSLVVGIASKYLSKYNKKLRTFSIGIPGSTDRYYAELVANYCNTDHTHIELTVDDFLEAVNPVIYRTETFDITTIRASVGQYLVSKWISENTDIKVLLIGDGSDELTSGYMYFHKTPDPLSGHNENIRLLKNIHYFDVLRADRGIASNGLEARVPFLTKSFVKLYLQIPYDLRIPYNHDDKREKWLLRRSFKNQSIIPDEVLYRPKEAFSDGVSSKEKSWYTILQENILIDSLKVYDYLPPKTKESAYYRDVFTNFFGDINIIPYFWLPKWCGDIEEPSARVLDVYK